MDENTNTRQPNQHHDPHLATFMKKIADLIDRILSVFIGKKYHYSFWQSHGEKLVEKIDREIKISRKP